MPISPWTTGATLPQWAATITDDSGAAVNLTGATLSLIIRNTQTGQETTGAGAWTITNATNGQASYAWAAGDSAVAGVYSLIVKIAFSGGGEMICDAVPWTVQPS